MKQQAILDNKLIENALKLTGKTMEEFSIGKVYRNGFGESDGVYNRIPIEKFCYYLLSPEFIEKYLTLKNENALINRHMLSMGVGQAIYEYQLNNPEPLNNLLQKIGAK